MKNIISIFTLFVILAFVPITTAQNTSDIRTFTVEQLKEDFLQLRQAFESKHPAKYKFTEKSVFDTFFDNRLAMIDKPMSAREFYRIIAPFFGMVGCGHTRLSLPDHFWQGAKTRMLPLKLRIIGDKVYVVDSYAENSNIAPGSEVQFINGEPVREIVEKLKGNIHSDAFINTFRTRRLNRRFAVNYVLQFGFHDNFEFVLIPPGDAGFSTKTRLESVSLDQVTAERWQMKHELKCFKNSDYALLTINSFSSYPSLDQVRNFLDDSFAEIAGKQIGNLIIDLRGNSGGDPHFAAHLLTYIESEAKIYFSVPYQGYQELAEPLPPSTQNRFLGDLYILIDGEGFSTTGHFCSLLRYHGIGTLIGEELGSTYTCNDNSQNITLTHTGFSVRMPTQSYATAVKNLPDSQGIQPDHHVVTNIGDILSGRDNVLEYALEMIRTR